MTIIPNAAFFARLKGVIDRGWIPIPDCPGYGGTGAPGLIVVSDTQAYRQFGNAVVPKVALAVGEKAVEIIRHFFLKKT